jgi:hypothetical protein
MEITEALPVMYSGKSSALPYSCSGTLIPEQRLRWLLFVRTSGPRQMARRSGEKPAAQIADELVLCLLVAPCRLIYMGLARLGVLDKTHFGII